MTARPLARARPRPPPEGAERVVVRSAIPRCFVDVSDDGMYILSAGFTASNDRRVESSVTCCQCAVAVGWLVVLERVLSARAADRVHPHEASR